MIINLLKFNLVIPKFFIKLIDIIFFQINIINK